MVISLRSRCEDAFTSSPGAAVIPFPSPPVIFPIPQEIRLSLGIRISSTARSVSKSHAPSVVHRMAVRAR